MPIKQIQNTERHQ